MNPSQASRLPVTIRVLFIDDDIGAHEMLGAIMRIPPPANVQLFSALDVATGLQMIEDDKPHVVLLDLNLSAQYRGETTIDQVLPMMADRVPTIIMTGVEDDSMWSRAIERGAMNYLAKDVYIGPAGKHPEESMTSVRGALLHSLLNAMFVHEAIHKRMSFLHGTPP